MIDESGQAEPDSHVSPTAGTPSVSVVVPVYNSATTLETLIQRLKPVLDTLVPAYELILVDDGSTDSSWSSIEELSSSHHWVRGIRMMRNYGQHNALLCGARSAVHTTILTMDDDLQHPPEEIPKLFSALSDSVDVVYGSPIEDQHNGARRFASRITKWALQKTMGAETASKVSAFRLFRSDLRSAFSEYSSQFVSIDVLLTWGTIRFTSVEVSHDARTSGQSTYTLGKLVTHALNMLTGFSTVPLQIASVTGFLFVLFGIGVLAFVIGRQLFFLEPGESVPGFTFLASITAIFAGAQLFALGIIGEYLARMHFRMMERPPYAVKADTSSQ